MEINNIEVGHRIFTIRKNLKMTQETFGAKFGAKKGLVSRWEKGLNLPNRERIEEIADLAGISVNELLYGSVDEFNYSLFNDYWENEEIPQNIRQKGKDHAFRIFSKTWNNTENKNFDGFDYHPGATKEIMKEVIENLDSFDDTTFSGVIDKVRGHIFEAALDFVGFFFEPVDKTDKFSHSKLKEGFEEKTYFELLEALAIAEEKIIKIAKSKGVQLFDEWQSVEMLLRDEENYQNHD